MKPKPRQTKTPIPRDPDRDRDEAAPCDDEREPRRERQWRIGAAQLAAPSTRRWRRAGTFGSTN